MGGRHKFAWKAFWDSNPDWSCLSSDLGEAAMPEESAAVPQLCVQYPDIRLTTEEISTETPQSGS